MLSLCGYTGLVASVLAVHGVGANLLGMFALWALHGSFVHVGGWLLQPLSSRLSVSVCVSLSLSLHLSVLSLRSALGFAVSPSLFSALSVRRAPRGALLPHCMQCPTALPRRCSDTGAQAGQLWFEGSWERQLSEAGFLALFLCPLWGSGTTLSKAAPPQLIPRLVLVWQLFRCQLLARVVGHAFRFRCLSLLVAAAVAVAVAHRKHTAPTATACLCTLHALHRCWCAPRILFL